VLSDGTDAAASYVGLTRGRYSNIVHIIADSFDDAREQWAQAAGRNRADLGLDQARAAAGGEAGTTHPTQLQASLMTKIDDALRLHLDL